MVTYGGFICAKLHNLTILLGFNACRISVYLMIVSTQLTVCVWNISACHQVDNNGVRFWQKRWPISSGKLDKIARRPLSCMYRDNHLVIVKCLHSFGYRLLICILLKNKKTNCTINEILFCNVR